MPAPQRRGRRPRVVLGLAAGVGLLGLVNSRLQPEVDARVLMARAESRLRGGDATGARGDFERAARLAPEDYEPYNGLARALEALGQMQPALAADESVLAITARHPGRLDERRVALQNYALAGCRLGELQRARGALGSLRVQGGSTLATDLWLGLAHLESGDVDAAARLQADMKGRYGDIEAVWRYRLLVRAGGVAPAARIAAELFLGLRQPRPELPAVRDAAQQARDAGHHPALASAALGETQLLSGQAEAAATTLAPLAGGPFAPFGELLLGQIELLRRDPETALRRFESAGAAENAAPAELLHYQRGVALYQLGRLDEAAHEMGMASAANPLSERSALALGRIESQRQRLQDATVAYAGALEIDPQHPEALFQLGALLLTAGRRDEATRYLQRYLELQPQGAHAAEARRLLGPA